MKYFVVFNYLSKAGSFLFGNTTEELETLTENSLSNLTSKLEEDFDSRPNRLKIIQLIKLDS